MTSTGQNYALLRTAAELIARHEDSPGFLDRFAQAIEAGPQTAGEVLDLALAARARAGQAELTLRPGELRVGVTSSGASFAACVLATAGGSLTGSLRLLDREHEPVAGAVIMVAVPPGGERMLVTDLAGAASVTGAGPELTIRVGATAGQYLAAPADEVIAMPRAVDQSQLDLAAAHRGSDRGADPDGDQLAERWRIQAGGVSFWCLERQGGYDITAQVTELPPGFAETAAGYGARFVTVAGDGTPSCWVVPLAPNPLGLAGTLYGTDADGLDPVSVTVGPVTELVAGLGADLADVISRSVSHADVTAGWYAAISSLGPEQHTVVATALTARQDDA